MNERIQQLEKQSYTEARHELGGTYMAFDKEKFAELIVRESIDVVARASASPNGYQALMKHFGI
jgi:predicted Fe-Mo cluster-binding NifX family protein